MYHINAPLLDIEAVPLTPAAFTPFGQVVQNPRYSALSPYEVLFQSARSVPANNGTGIKYVDPTDIVNVYSIAPSKTPSKPVINMFSMSPRTLQSRRDVGREVGIPQHGHDLRRTFPVVILERHRFTTQTFVPMGLESGDATTKYLILVAPNRVTTDGSPGLRCPPDLSKLRAFVAHGGQAITYRQGVWHAPMAVLGLKTVDFVVIQNMNGIPSEDCEEVTMDTPNKDRGICVHLPRRFDQVLSKL